MLLLLLLLLSIYHVNLVYLMVPCEDVVYEAFHEVTVALAQVLEMPQVAVVIRAHVEITYGRCWEDSTWITKDGLTSCLKGGLLLTKRTERLLSCLRLERSKIRGGW